jgi:hypothetical protein
MPFFDEDLGHNTAVQGPAVGGTDITAPHNFVGIRLLITYNEGKRLGSGLQIKKKVKLAPHRPGQALRIPGG